MNYAKRISGFWKANLIPIEGQDLYQGQLIDIVNF